MTAAKTILTLLSLLHEDADSHSGLRLFRNKPVLDWTLRRTAAAGETGPTALICWDDQHAALESIAGQYDVTLISLGKRRSLPNIEAISAARRWSDGWRCGPLGASAFDAGFHAPAALDAMDRFAADAVLIVDPAAGLVDPLLLATVIRRWREMPELEFTFTPAATGLGAILLARSLVERLRSGLLHPGRILAYFPDQVSRELTSGDHCVPAPTPAARSTHRFSLSSERQIQKLASALADLNGQLIGTASEALAQRVGASVAANPVDALPREAVLELTTRRQSRPIFSPLAAGTVDRPDLTFEQAVRLIDDLSKLDDARLTLAGVGDPLSHPQLMQIIGHAAARNVSVNVETDLLSEDNALIDALAASSVDVISIHVPALTDSVYEQVMGVDGYRRVLANIHRVVSVRAAAGRGTPLVIPLFVKCRINQHEMESWYDQWLRAVGSAAILGPSDFSGTIADAAVADMAPPRRVPCRRLSERLAVLSDGHVTSCEQDFSGTQAMGRVGAEPLRDIWQTKLVQLRNAHRDGRWNELPVCARCREWHRP